MRRRGLRLLRLVSGVKAWFLRAFRQAQRSRFDKLNGAVSTSSTRTVNCDDYSSVRVQLIHRNRAIAPFALSLSKRRAALHQIASDTPQRRRFKGKKP